MGPSNSTSKDQGRVDYFALSEYQLKTEHYSMIDGRGETDAVCQTTRPMKKDKKLASVLLSWWSEFTFCIGGLLTFTIIVVILWQHDQKPQPQWPLGITLNALLALLSTTSKASFMISMAEVISQWKWNLHDTPKGRSFHDFTLIDLASRGFWGSCLLLQRFKWRHPISLAALISLASVLTSPLTQQTIDYPTRSVGTYGATSVGATRHWTALGLDDERMQLDALLTQALHAGVKNIPKPIDAVCPTARCTTEPYESLAMCAKVADVSRQLKVSTVNPDVGANGIPRGMSGESLLGTELDGSTSLTYYLTLPNNITFDHNYPFAFHAITGNGTLAFPEDEAYNTSLVHMYIIHTRYDDRRGEVDVDAPPEAFPDPPEFGAFEVMLHLCVKEYQTVVEAGRSRTTVRRTRAVSLGTKDSSARSGGSGNETAPMPVDRIPSLTCQSIAWDGPGIGRCSVSNHTGSVILAGVDSDRREDGLVVDASLHLDSMAMAIAYAAESVYIRLRLSDGGMITAYRAQWSRRLRDALYGKGRNVTDPAEQAKGLQVFWGGVATSLSNVIRTTNETDVFRGTAWDTEVYVNIRWGWLSFLAAELVLATIFTVFTASKTYRAGVPVLKSSALAAFLAPDSEAQRLMGSIDDLDSAEAKSKLARIRFDHRNLVLVLDVDDTAMVVDVASRSSSVHTVQVRGVNEVPELNERHG